MAGWYPESNRCECIKLEILAEVYSYLFSPCRRVVETGDGVQHVEVLPQQLKSHVISFLWSDNNSAQWLIWKSITILLYFSCNSYRFCNRSKAKNIPYPIGAENTQRTGTYFGACVFLIIPLFQSNMSKRGKNCECCVPQSGCIGCLILA